MESLPAQEYKELKKRFRHAIWRGTGETHLIMREFPQVDFYDEIAYGVRNICAYDGQCETGRGQYIFELIQMSARQDELRAEVIRGLKEECEESWNLTHLFETAACFAEQGDEEMKQVIRSQYANQNMSCTSWAGESQILELDGFDGLVFVAETKGRWLLEGKGDHVDSSDLNEVMAKDSKADLRAELASVAEENIFVAAYLKELEKKVKERDESKPRPRPWEKNKHLPMAERILKGPRFFLHAKKLAQQATDADAVQVAEKCLVETDLKKLNRYLQFFGYRPFPLDPVFLLDLAQSDKKKHRDIQFSVRGALAKVQSNTVRVYAMARLQVTSRPGECIGMLERNYQEGDEVFLESLLQSTHDEHAMEQFAQGLRSIYKANPTPRCKGPLELLYQKSNCAICRFSVLKLLLENDVLSDRIQQEIEFDCYLDTRDLRPRTMSPSDA